MVSFCDSWWGTVDARFMGLGVDGKGIKYQRYDLSEQGPGAGLSFAF